MSGVGLLDFLFRNLNTLPVDLWILSTSNDMYPSPQPIFENPQIQQQLNQINEEYVDVHELLMTWMEASGWRNTRSLIKKMTPEMKQRQQATNPAVQKAQADAQKMQAQGQQKASLQAQKEQGGMARDVLKAALEQGNEHVLRQADENAGDTLAGGQ